jgi:hypothetical protein
MSCSAIMLHIGKRDSRRRAALRCVASQEDVFAVQKMVLKPESRWEGKATEAAWPVQLMHMVRVCSTALELA